MLVQAGLIDDTQLASALAQVEQWGTRLTKVVVEMLLAKESAVVDAVARGARCAKVALHQLKVDPSAVALLDAQTCEQLGAFAFVQKDNKQVLGVGMPDPTDSGALQLLGKKTGRQIVPAVIPESVLAKAIQKHYHRADVSLEPDPDSTLISEMSEFKLVDSRGKTLMVSNAVFVGAGANLQLSKPSERAASVAAVTDPTEFSSVNSPMLALEEQPAPPPPANPAAQLAALNADRQVSPTGTLQLNLSDIFGEEPLPPAPPAQPAAAARPDVSPAELLCKLPLFAGCPAATVEKIVGYAETLDFPKGATVVAAGARHDWLGVVLQGRLHVHWLPPRGGTEVPFEALGPGDCFGELNALVPDVSPFSVRCDGPVRVLKLRAELFASVYQRVPSLGGALGRKLAERFAKVLHLARKTP